MKCMCNASAKKVRPKAVKVYFKCTSMKIQRWLPRIPVQLKCSSSVGQGYFTCGSCLTLVIHMRCKRSLSQAKCSSKVAHA
eukprot:6807923-Pyramimonas_sp.AAC.1